MGLSAIPYYSFLFPKRINVVYPIENCCNFRHWLLDTVSSTFHASSKSAIKLFSSCLLIMIADTTTESTDGCTDGCTSASLTSYKPADRADPRTASSTS
jgi:hypothetical protein